jgi:hypothetical protein
MKSTMHEIFKMIGSRACQSLVVAAGMPLRSPNKTFLTSLIGPYREDHRAFR